jgi:uncharacterized LabA/DUF88 family protein
LRVAVLIDGGHLRVLAQKNKLEYTPEYVEKIAQSCVNVGENLLRVLYYDCAPYKGTVKLPISGNEKKFDGSNAWLKSLAEKDYFAVRQGVLKFRGFVAKKTLITQATLTDADFKPTFEQKGVDMRIGLDMASFSERRSVDRIILITADTDCIPAMKYCRKAGLQVALISFPNQHLAPELLYHADFRRGVSLPK